MHIRVIFEFTFGKVHLLSEPRDAKIFFLVQRD